jgi:hypothetical protein
LYLLTEQRYQQDKTEALSSRILLLGDGVDVFLLENFVLGKLIAASLVKKFHDFS